ncbi:MAG: hypothetical protein V4574_19360 [Pseudomonadota bacterium]
MHDMHMEHCEMPASTSSSRVVEFPLDWPGSKEKGHAGPACHPTGGGSTHEIIYDRNGGTVFWVSGQAYDCIARVTLDGEAEYFKMDEGRAPHGMAYDHEGRLWLTFEGTGHLAQIGTDGKVVGDPVDVAIYPSTGGRINTRPHGLGVASDGALWFTGKLTNTMGRVTGREVQHFALPTFGAVPIYIAAGADGDVWCTALSNGRIGHVTRDGIATDYPIPTGNSRPIAIVPAPDGKAFWFTEEAGGKVGRIDLPFDPKRPFVEFPVPLTQSNAILGALAFDKDGALWVQQYVNPPGGGAMPTANDYIVKLTGIEQAQDGDMTGVGIEYFKAPSKGSVMHRIIQGPDGNIWFTELGLNQVGRVAL